MRTKHVPIRTCAACRSSGEKRGLLRVVRGAGGVVFFDPTGKANGRGAYVCANESCIALAQKQKKLDRSLKAEVPGSIFDSLRAAAGDESLPQSNEATKNNAASW